mgnify:FL=1|jgi:hypothetical protein
MAYTLADLETDIKGYTEVNSNVFTTAVLNRFITNAEAKIYRTVDADLERHYATSSLVVGNRYVTIPDDLRTIRYVQIKDASGNQTYLDQRDPSFMAEYYSTPNTQSTDIPKYYGNWDEEFWVVAPTPNTAFDITLAYNKDPISLTDTANPSAAPASTNGTYLSNKYPDLILYASLVNAYGYLKGPTDMIQYYQAQYKEAIETYAIEQEGRRRRNEYNDGVTRISLKSESPSSY